ncbi:DMT family transporter [Plastoroseomonas hellenica]|uniref:DMT family transporter n=1 Tax=Plastoroseomonas hellenica TaxID=2687306 RepID=UPI001BAE51EF|nr:EamA family transporter [Plastoroseomonas hellenica]MBR0645333.1 EamA family transporter [Plastoroseomonas hellenica]
MSNLALFGLMSLIWGATWAAVKIGLDGVPPLTLAAARFLLVGAILTAAAGGAVRLAFGPRWPRVLASGTLINTATYGLLFWGMQSVPSGLSGMINLSLIPVLLFLLAVMMGEERIGWRHGGALLLGLAGLATLFAPRLASQGQAELLGIAAIVAGTVTYCLGSLAAKPLLREEAPLAVAGAQAIASAALLVPLAWIIEGIDGARLAALAQPAALGSLAYLVLAGSILAYTIYLRLMRDWGMSRAGLYAFVSPVVALVIGRIAFGERIGAVEIAGTILLLCAAGLSLGGKVATRASVLQEVRGPVQVPDGRGWSNGR